MEGTQNVNTSNVVCDSGCGRAFYCVATLQVPTVDTVRYTYLMKKLVQAKRPVMLNGVSGVGKSVLASSSLDQWRDELRLQVISIQFSAQTSSSRTQEMIESKLKVRL